MNVRVATGLPTRVKILVCAIFFIATLSHSTASPLLAQTQLQTDTISSRPFSRLGIGVDFGSQGGGFDVATILGRDFNLRGGGDFLSIGETVSSNNINFTPAIALKSGQMSLDWFPFHGRFHVSPGVLFYNGTNVSAGAAVGAGQAFTLNSNTYYSSATSPLNGNLTIVWPKAGPRFTIGFGNLLPRKASQHFSLNTELGFAYFGTAKATLVFAGSECHQATTQCQSAASDTTFQNDVQADQKIVQDDLIYVRFYPIIRLGIGYKF